MPNPTIFTFDALLHKVPDLDGAYIEFPHDLFDTFGKRRVRVHCTFDGVPYDGICVRMGTECPIVGVTKAIRKEMGKQPGDVIKVTLQERG